MCNFKLPVFILEVEECLPSLEDESKSELSLEAKCSAIGWIDVSRISSCREETPKRTKKTLKQE